MAPSVTAAARPQGRWVLAATIAGSGMAFLDSTVVNVALAQIGDDFDAGFTALQWITNAYTLTLAALILLGGVLGDRLGRRRVFLVGVVWFAVASALCALSPSTEVLIAARALQGVGGALLTPGSLAIISSVFASRRPAAGGRAVGRAERARRARSGRSWAAGWSRWTGAWCSWSTCRSPPSSSSARSATSRSRATRSTPYDALDLTGTARRRR